MVSSRSFTDIDDALMSAYNRQFTPRTCFLLLLGPNARLGPLAFLTRGQQDALGDGHSRASWGSSQSSPPDPHEQQTGQYIQRPQLGWCLYHSSHVGPGRKPWPSGQRAGFAFGVTPRGPGQHCLTLICLAQH